MSRTPRFARLAAMVAVTSMAIAEPARAFPSSRLVYTRGPGAEHCPDESVLRLAVAKRLGYDPFFPTAARTIVASIVRDAEKLKAQAELVDDHGIVRGSREYVAEPARCDELVHALALSISISIDPANAPPSDAPDARKPPPEVATKAMPSAPAPEPRPVPERPDALAARDEEPRAAPSAPSSSLQWAAGLGARLWLGAEPSTTLGPAGSLAVRLGRASLGLEVGGDLPSTTEIAGPGGTFAVRSSLLWAALTPCVHADPFFFCGVIMAGRLSLHRSDAPAIGDSNPVAFSGGRVGIDWPLGGSFGLRAQGDLLATLVRTPVTWLGQEVWQTPIAVGAFSIAFLAYFP